ncbi:MAG: diguanylate cyclase [Candidatus Hydrogenedens sp.]|nr:diguanylate cyclase [Candidatus Hydrogenedens sp.]
MIDKEPKTSDNQPSTRSTVLLTPLGKEQGKTDTATLVALSGWEIGKTIALDQSRMVLGRAPGCDIVINLHSVSREHALIEKRDTPEGPAYFISDLGSSNGTQVNATPIVQTRLKADDKVRMGEVVFRFIHDDAVEHQYHQEVHRRIHFHELTGLMTLPSTKDKLADLLSSSPPGSIHTIAMTDLDGLKAINDTHGHQAGSFVIEKMGEMIRNVLHEDEFAGIYGGDECLICFPNTPLSEAYKTLECLRVSIEQYRFMHTDRLLRVTMSIGLAAWPIHGQRLSDLMESADEALYEAKRTGRNKVVVVGDAQG